MVSLCAKEKVYCQEQTKTTATLNKTNCFLLHSCFLSFALWLCAEWPKCLYLTEKNTISNMGSTAISSPKISPFKTSCVKTAILICPREQNHLQGPRRLCAAGASSCDEPETSPVLKTVLKIASLCRVIRVTVGEFLLLPVLCCGWQWLPSQPVTPPGFLRGAGEARGHQTE